MTHSLHREGTIDSLDKDYAVFIYPARGYNYKGCEPRVRRLVEIVYQVGPANMIATTLRRNFYSGVTPEAVLDSIREGCRVFSVFNSRDKIRELLARFKEADQGISIVVSGLIDRVREIAAEVGLEPHTINLSLGVHGATGKLPAADIRQFTTMCGHAMIAPGLVKDALRKVKTGKIDSWNASLLLARPCACGIYNPYRSRDLIEELEPLYSVTRW
ncbi:MAG: hypothetical protein LJE64_12475 [Desulfofustis sp.]|jgi:hypothetical protein|nr:hypothetical protein [Desulfofustis sp.]